jgi:hypothetical protein
MITAMPERTARHPAAQDDAHPACRHGISRWLLVTAGSLLFGYLLFCHGCHGDEDNELFLRGETAFPVGRFAVALSGPQLDADPGATGREGPAGTFFRKK